MTDPSIKPHERLARLAGSWSGTARTWLDPAKPPLEASLEGRVAPILEGRFVRFEYRSSLDNRPLTGELVVGYDEGEHQWTASWIDSFHMGTAIMACTGKAGAEIAFGGTYYVGDGDRWRWRTVLDDAAPDRLVVRMYNGTPDGQHEDPAVELALERRPG